ncbi:PTH1 family peptidyl-tRNA hydrolase [Chryseomicrobium aureum]|uniref:aminoacyl-tRNA hydrolase n=1 Tax=Chryseomicrobium aureum TaxID=1441723 RepID=UPI00195BC566|nr:aminoacyl-tRNA hydrolase [Chryseomicrobium aureum]MBM7707280.1 PTH1 family peptidyl-tRNA hydrolase [Chryseomicrobium aureum]
MKMIIGLGNPGKKYEKTRHNIGFLVIDELAKQYGVELNQTKFHALYAIAHTPKGKVLLVKPYTYMNLSGEAVAPLMKYFDIPVDDIVVIYDDLDLGTGKLRLRQRGSAGGHNGIKSLIQHLGTQNFNRIRIGISRPPAGMKVADYVLANFREEEQPDMARAIDNSAEACKTWMDKPFLEVMNDYNGA